MLRKLCWVGLCCTGVSGVVASADGLEPPHPFDAVLSSSIAGSVGPAGGLRGGGICDECVIELHILVDQALFLQIGDGVRAYVDEVVFKMDAIWAQPFAQGGIGVGIVLTELTVFEDGDPWEAESNSFALINLVDDFVQSEIPVRPDGRDAVILLSGADLSTFGVGFVGELCQAKSIGVAQAGCFATEFVASNASHQLGHIAGSAHDGSAGDNGCADLGFIMGAPNRSMPASRFSNCSLGSIVEYLLRPGLDIPVCLAPTIPVCQADLTGDGLLDFFDVSAFLDAFASQDSVADFTNDGGFDFFDVSGFLDAFAEGCL